MKRIIQMAPIFLLAITAYNAHAAATDESELVRTQTNPLLFASHSKLWNSNVTLQALFGPAQHQNQAFELGEFLHRCIIDDPSRATNDFSSPIKYQEIHAFDAGIQHDREDPEQKNHRNELIRSTGIREETIRIDIDIRRGIYDLRTLTRWDKERPNPEELALFKEATNIDLISPSLSEIQKNEFYSLALARALLHKRSFHAIHYLLALCEPNADLSPYMMWQIFIDEQKRGTELVSRTMALFACKAIPSLLHAAVLGELMKGARPDHKPYPGHRTLNFIEELLKRGARASVKDSDGMTPLDMLKAYAPLIEKDIAEPCKEYPYNRTIQALEAAMLAEHN